MKTPDLSNLPKVNEPPKLPTIQELFEDSLELAGKSEGLNAILNTPPPQKWIKEHPYIPGWLYLPIDKVEYLLTKIYKRWHPEVLERSMLMNSVAVTIRLHYFNPATDQMEFADGVGACELQTASKTGPLKMDMSNVNRGAVPMALPIAKSAAIKDAAECLGKIFGKDLNRKDTLAFQPDLEIIDRVAKRKELLENKSKSNV